MAAVVVTHLLHIGTRLREWTLPIQMLVTEGLERPFEPPPTRAKY